jgi:hypothetical protein
LQSLRPPPNAESLLREGELYRLRPSLDVAEALARATSKASSTVTRLRYRNVTWWLMSVPGHSRPIQRALSAG